LPRISSRLRNWTCRAHQPSTLMHELQKSLTYGTSARGMGWLALRPNMAAFHHERINLCEKARQFHHRKYAPTRRPFSSMPGTNDHEGLARLHRISICPADH